MLTRLTRQVRIQLAVFAALSLTASVIMFFNFMQVPTVFFGVDRYTVTVKLPQAGGLYPGGNVTYRGVEVGRVQAVRLTPTGVEALLQLDSDVHIPADLNAQVHSVSAVGEQYVELLPRSAKGPSLKDGDVIAQDRTYVPPDINSLLEATNRGLTAIPRDNLKTVVDEGYVAVGGLGPELSRLVKGTANLAIDARKNLDALVTLIDEPKPLLDSQIQSSDAIQAWAAHLATITSQLRDNDAAVAGLLQKGGPAVGEARQLLDRLSPTLPIVLANLVSVGQVGVVYRDNLESLLVELPQGTADIQAVGVANRNTKQDYNGAFLSFNLNLNWPPPCTTGFLPAQQQRAASYEDYPDPPNGDFYCRIPQDSILNVRGARNAPCETRPGKRAPTVKLCESDEAYVPLNDGFNWKGDPNATYTGQGVPQFRPGEEPPGYVRPPAPPGPPPPPIAAVHYDPATGMYIGPDGRMYTQADLAHGATKERTWQSMLTPPKRN
ncbi:MCE family protein [Mycobacterium heckeshornense]|uniref:Mammalian cell entry protein n=1 Tax=Mycobacterium heckeshornense TaxID=110505 RepID=A0A2I3EXE8_9MYCO|nr:MlaD family protein [Mycobacterium heckeshornense]KMV24149.1 mammalian cell entry protein [Mycobacterium heckeshornense]MCV7036365.1 MCE family protein [Mycobacterium heckeshornense]BCO34222.1 mammalian cell entry protein [Mycobacterium heckeshornense]